jgi:putative ABC transport system permease protein
MKFLYLIWTNLMRKKLRTLLTLLSILVAFLLFGYLGAIRQGFSAGIDVAGLDRLIVRHKVSIIQMLPEAYESRIEQIEGVVDAVHQTWFGGIYQKPTNFFAQLPVKPEEYLAMYPEFQLSDEERKAWLATRSGAVAGRGTAERFGWKVGDRIPINATIWTRHGGESSWEFDLVGIYDGAEKGTDNTQFLFRYDFFDESRQFGQGLVGWYTVRVADPDRAAEVAAAIDAEFANSPNETKAEPEGFRQPDGQHRFHHDVHHRRGVLHHPAGCRQHHGLCRARAHQRTGGAQGRRLQRPHGAGTGPRGVLAVDRAGRRPGPGARVAAGVRGRSDRRRAAAVLHTGP